MLLIIDAYNILKQMSHAQLIDDAQRTAFIKKIESYAHEKNNQVILVFDGGEYVRPTKYSFGSVTVIYAGFNDSADDVIKQIVLRGVNPTQTILVSSDRELCNFVTNFRIATIDSPDFFQLLSHTAKPKATSLTGIAQKIPGYESSSELDALMEEASAVGMYKQEEVDNANRVRAARQETKQNKKLKRLVKKL